MIEEKTSIAGELIYTLAIWDFNRPDKDTKSTEEALKALLEEEKESFKNKQACFREEQKILKEKGLLPSQVKETLKTCFTKENLSEKEKADLCKKKLYDLFDEDAWEITNAIIEVYRLDYIDDGDQEGDVINYLIWDYCQNIIRKNKQ